MLTHLRLRKVQTKIRAVFILVLLAVTGCAHFNDAVFHTQLPMIPQMDSQPEVPIQDDTNSFDASNWIGSMSPADVAVTKDYIGLTLKEAFALAERQSRSPEIGSWNGKRVPLRAAYRYSGIIFDVTNGIVTRAALELNQ